MNLFRKKKKRIINPVIERKMRPRDKSGGGGIGKIFRRLLIFVFLAVSVYAVFFSGFLAVTEVKVLGAKKTDPEAIMREVFTFLSGKYLWIIPKNNIVLASKDRLSEVMETKLKLIANLETEREFPDTLILSVNEKDPKLIFRSRGKDHVVDEKGKAWPKSDFESEFLAENRLPIFEDLSGKDIVEKEEIISQDYLEFILEINEQLARDLGISIDQKIETPSIASGDAFVLTSEGWKIYLNKDVGIKKEIEMLKAVLNGKIEDKRQDLEYVDLRTDNKVYYKFR